MYLVIYGIHSYCCIIFKYTYQFKSCLLNFDHKNMYLILELKLIFKLY